ncbi:MAG TPA: CBS domain-containing protein [Rhizobacter sp.]|nr:CBS domain-containing protein [Rhizobacter sp.]
MSQVAKFMTRGVRSMSPGDTLQCAAQAMEELDVGAIPVCDGERVVGIVTDRDITVRGVAPGLPIGSTPISEVMTEGVEYCFEDESIEEAREQMQSAQIRRLPVLDRQKRLVGILALGDVAAKVDSDQAGEALADISEPAEPDRSGDSAASGAAGGGSASEHASRMA